jgi:hypothetical protein
MMNDIEHAGDSNLDFDIAPNSQSYVLCYVEIPILYRGITEERSQLQALVDQH